MNTQQVETIKKELTLRETDDLIEIWQLNNKDEWTVEAFEAIRQILVSRLGSLPQQENQEEADKHLGLIQQYLDVDQLDKALQECELAIKIAPHSAEAYHAQGIVLDEMGRLDEAIASYQKAIYLNPSLADAKKDLRYASKPIKKEKVHMKENLRGGEIAKVKKRHGCFTAWLVFMSVIYFAVGIFVVAQGGYSSLPRWSIPVQIAGLLGSLAAVIALFKWKKWGFWLFCGSQLVAFGVNLLNSVGIGRALYGLISILILYGVLNIGKENKGWTQLE